MSEEKPEATLAAGNQEIKFCPFCGAEFSEYLELNKKQTCPTEGGCGISFTIYKK